MFAYGRKGAESLCSHWFYEVVDVDVIDKINLLGIAEADKDRRRRLYARRNGAWRVAYRGRRMSGILVLSGRVPTRGGWRRTECSLTHRGREYFEWVPSSSMDGRCRGRELRDLDEVDAGPRVCSMLGVPSGGVHRRGGGLVYTSSTLFYVDETYVLARPKRDEVSQPEVRGTKPLRASEFFRLAEASE